LAFEKAK